MNYENEDETENENEDEVSSCFDCGKSEGCFCDQHYQDYRDDCDDSHNR